MSIVPVAILAALAPRPLHQQVDTQAGATAICRGGAYDDGPVISVVPACDAGPYPIFQVTCQDGLQETVAH